MLNYSIVSYRIGNYLYVGLCLPAKQQHPSSPHLSPTPAERRPSPTMT